MQLDLDFKAPLTVSELTHRIKDALESGFPDVWVQGEITGIRTPSSGHMYFALKDQGAQIRAVFFRSGNRSLRFTPVEGLEVIVRGRVTLYEQRGEYQVIVEYMEPMGLGALQLAFLQLKEKLEREGLFDPAHKRPLPGYPKRVGVVTSPTGAAIRDILKVLKRRAPGVEVLVAPASVQGDTAPAEIASAIASLNDLGGLDVLIVGRGGGSMEDLAAFNTEVVARAVYSSSIPVISAVGHEVDFTISDFVADLRAPTPSAAAEVVARSEEDLKETLRVLRGRSTFTLSHSLKFLRARMDSQRRSLVDPRKAVHEHFMRLDDLTGRLVLDQRRISTRLKEHARSMSRSLMHLSPASLVRLKMESLSTLDRRLSRGIYYSLLGMRERLKHGAVRLTALDPLAPLSRGYAIALKLPELTTITDTAQVDVGGRLRVRLKDGELDCRVEEKRREA